MQIRITLKASRLFPLMTTSSPLKRPRFLAALGTTHVQADNAHPTLRALDYFSVPGLSVKDFYVRVPLIHGQSDSTETLEVFVREVVQEGPVPTNRPVLLFLQGGPGHESPRPLDGGQSWIKAAVTHYRVLLMDQRGTGLSAPISALNLPRRGTPQQQADYLASFRADSIVLDAEAVRAALVPLESCNGRMALLGQSFGGFCCLTYLSIRPHGLTEVMLTGGLPPGISLPCAAHDAYRSLFSCVLQQNVKFYERFPGDVQQVHRIVQHLGSLPGGYALLPSLGVLRPRGLQLLGLRGLGMATGFERLHYLLASAFDADGNLTLAFLKECEAWFGYDINPLYLILHESIYCQGAASNWAAHAVRQEPQFADAFDAISATEAGRPVMFTGEHVFPWMLEDFTALHPLREAADLIAAKSDWPQLYDISVLENTSVSVVSASYYSDMYVAFDKAQETAKHVEGIQQWITNEFLHSGIRDDGIRIFDTLLKMCRGCVSNFR